MKRFQCSCFCQPVDHTVNGLTIRRLCPVCRKAEYRAETKRMLVFWLVVVLMGGYSLIKPLVDVASQ